MRDKHRLRQKAHSWFRTAPRVAGVIALVVVLMLSSVAFTPGTVDAQATENWQTDASGVVQSIEIDQSSNDIYVSTDTRLYRFDESGSVIWNVSAAQEFEEIKYAPGENALYVVGIDGLLEKIDASDGSTTQSVSVSSRLDSVALAESEGEVIVLDGGTQTIYGYDLDLQSEQWSQSYTAGSGGSLSYQASTDRVYYATSDVKAIERSDRSVTWTYDTGAFNPEADVSSNSVYAANFNSETFRINNSGSEVWQRTGSDDDVDHFSGYVGFGNTLYDTDGNEIHTYSSSNSVGLYESGGHLSLIRVSGGSTLISETLDEDIPIENAVSGTVEDTDGNALENANVEISGEGINENDTTDQVGAYSFNVPEGTYDVTASKDGYITETQTVIVDGGTQTVNFRLEETENAIELDTRQLLQHGQSASYTVIVDNGSGRMDVTDEATVTSNNTSIVTVDAQAFEIVATNDTSVNAQTELTANYTDPDGTVFSTTKVVTVANVSVSNLEILPTGITRLWAVGTDNTMFIILIAAMMAVPATRFANAFAGIATAQMILVIGWLGGYVGLGMAMLSVFVAMFIGLNLAANIDYTVRR